MTALLWSDWTYAVRTLRRNPLFSLAAVLTTAVGIGACTTVLMYSTRCTSGLYLCPTLTVWLWCGRRRRKEMEQANGGVSGRVCLLAREFRLVPGRRGMGLRHPDAHWRTVAGTQVQRIGGDYFQALEIRPVVGRTFLPSDERSADCTLILSGRLWHLWFNERAGVAGPPLMADGIPRRIVGVMPEGFLPPVAASARVDAWVPPRLGGAAEANQQDHSLMVLGRLAHGVSARAVEAMLNQEAQRLGASIRDARGWGVKVMSLKEQVTGAPNKALLALAGAVGLLLLIACINVAALLQARAAGQRLEIAIRAALGASRSRLLLQLLTQSLVLAMLDGIGGLITTYWSLDALVTLANASVPRLNEAQIDWRVLLFTAALSLATGILFGFAPAIGNAKAAFRARHDGRSRPGWLRNGQIVVEIALAFVLLTAAGLLLRSFQTIRSVDLGIGTYNVFSANFARPPARYAGREQYVRFLNQVLERVRALPGVVSATATPGVPMRGSADGPFEILSTPSASAPQEVPFAPAIRSVFPRSE